MTVKELHLALQIQLNSVNAYLYDNLLEQEVDFYLNQAQEEYIKTHYSPYSNRVNKGFEETQKRIDDLRELVVKYYKDFAFTTEESNVYRFVLPTNYMFLVNQRSNVYYSNCGNAITTETINANEGEDIAILPFDPESYLLEGDTMSGFDIQVTGGTSILYTGTEPSAFSNYIVPFDNRSFVDYIISLNESYSSDYRIYWEYYNGVYSKDSFIIVYIGNGTSAVDVTAIYTDELDVTVDFDNTYENNYKSGLTGGEYEIKSNKFAQADDIYSLLEDPFNTTRPENPLTVIHSNKIDVFTNDTFIVKEVIISYIRQPKVISLSLGQSSELAPHTHKEIVKLAVNTILENVQSQRVQTNNSEIIKSE